MQEAIGVDMLEDDFGAINHFCAGTHVQVRQHGGLLAGCSDFDGFALFGSVVRKTST
jgi:hypothetical protein